jgi:hypothetical protein
MGWRWAPANDRLAPKITSVEWRRALAVFAIALAFKFGLGGVLFDPNAMAGNPWAFGFEVGNIAGNLAAGHGFSVSREPGVYIPTAWISPLYPMLLAGIFKVFGMYTLGAAQATLLANCIFQAGSAALLYLMGFRFAGRNAGRAAVVIFLLNPNGWQFLGWAWPSQLFAFLILLHFFVLLLPTKNDVVAASMAGGTFAMALMADGAAIAIAPVTVAHIFWTRSGSQRSTAFAAALIAFAIVVAPWTLRNAEHFGSYNPLRGNIGVNLWVGNYPGSNAEAFHGLAPSPWHDTEQGERFATLGEQQYDRDARGRALGAIANDPARFVGNTTMRFAGFWIGEFWTRYQHIHWLYSVGLIALSALALRGAIRARSFGTGALLAALLLFGGPYDLTVHGHGRYRVPVEPLMCLLAVLKPGDEQSVIDDEPQS